MQESETDRAELEALYADAVRDTIARFEATGSPVITDGEQRKPSFATYPIDGLELAPDGVVIPFADGHTRQLPRLTRGPFRYQTYADGYLAAARDIATRPVKQAVISASALSLLYPEDGIDGYPRDASSPTCSARSRPTSGGRSPAAPIASRSTSQRRGSR